MTTEIPLDAPPVLVRFFADGAREWSHPPALGATARALFVGFHGCPKCAGKGAVTAFMNRGQPYPSTCEVCFKRFNADPLRAHFQHRRATRWRWKKCRADELQRIIRRRDSDVKPEDFNQRVAERLDIHDARFQQWAAAFVQRHAEVITGTLWDAP